MSYHIELSDSIFEEDPQRINPIFTGTKPSSKKFWSKKN